MKGFHPEIRYFILSNIFTKKVESRKWLMVSPSVTYGATRLHPGRIADGLTSPGVASDKGAPDEIS